MTVLSRGARVRRGGRRPGWLLLTALLVLAIGASSALVFTNRVELLKLAVILALWAAVVAAFVSVIYRRQSDVDQARVRDLKLVYDLQLDREISARREYELTVESQLRRELAAELRAQAADEVAALRAELAALRTNLEILFDAELSHRPALETDRTTVRGYSEWERQDESPRDRFDRVTSVRPEESASRAEDRSIIDVPEEPLLPPRPAAPEPAPEPYPAAGAYRASEIHAPSPEAYRAEGHGSADWQRTEGSPWSPRARQPDQREWSHAHQSVERGWPSTQERFAAPPHRHAERPSEAPPPPAAPRFGETRNVAPQPEPEPPRRDWYTTAAEASQHREPASQWQPIGAEGKWTPPEAPESNWVPGRLDSPDVAGVAGNAANGSTTVNPVAEPPRSGRHASPAEPPVFPRGGTAMSWDYGESSRRPRHSAEHGGHDAGAGTATPAPSPPPESLLRAASAMSTPAEPTARHRSIDGPTEGPSSGAQSVAELLARLQAEPTGGRRRRREE
jgi:hypothetical protein